MDSFPYVHPYAMMTMTAEKVLLQHNVAPDAILAFITEHENADQEARESNKRLVDDLKIVSQFTQS